MAFFFNQNGNENFRGTAGEYDQVDYQGALADFTITESGNTVTVAHPTWGTDTLTSIEGFWFNGERVWYSMADALRLSGGNTGGGPGTFDGTAGHDVLIGSGANDEFYGGAGNDFIYGAGGARDTANFDGGLVEYTISRGANGDVLMSHPTWGEDTLNSVERLFFIRDGNEYSVTQAINQTNGLPDFRVDADIVINGTPNRDIMTGTNASESFYGGTGNDIYQGAGGFDQVNYDGALADYVVTQIPNGYIFEHPVWGVDILRSIEGLYFSGEGVWYPVVAATFGF